MERREMLRKLTVFTLILVMTVAFSPIFGAAKADAATKKGRLVKKVTVQSYDKSKKKWITYEKTAYTYNKKGDPIKIKTNKYNEKGKVTESTTKTNKYTYTKKSVRKTRTMRWKKSTDDDYTESYTERWTYDRNGNPKQLKEYFSDTDGRWTNSTYKFTYSKKGWYLKKADSVSTNQDADEEAEPDKDSWKYQPSQKKYLLKSFVVNKVNDDGSLEIEESYKYNKMGCIKSVKDQVRGYTESYRYKTKNGRVTTVTVKCINEYGDVSYTRYKFTYTKKKTGKIRYAKMINEMIRDYSLHQYYAWY